MKIYTFCARYITVEDVTELWKMNYLYFITMFQTYSDKDLVAIDVCVCVCVRACVRAYVCVN